MWLDLGLKAACPPNIIYIASEGPKKWEGENHGVSNI